MTRGPYLLPGARAGYRYGDATIVDATSQDALFCAFDQLSMGTATEFYSKDKRITRAEQDEYAAMSHERATRARRRPPLLGRYVGAGSRGGVAKGAGLLRT